MMPARARRYCAVGRRAAPWPAPTCSGRSERDDNEKDQAGDLGAGAERGGARAPGAFRLGRLRGDGIKDGVKVSVVGETDTDDAAAAGNGADRRQLRRQDRLDPPGGASQADRGWRSRSIATGGSTRTGLPRCRSRTDQTLDHAGSARTPAASPWSAKASFCGERQAPEQSPFPSEGKVLAFNGRLHGTPVIFAHIYGTQPSPTSYVLPLTSAPPAPTERCWKPPFQR